MGLASLRQLPCSARSDPGNLIVECFVFPGNSGGPVIYVPTIKVDKSITTPLYNEERLVGVLSSEIAYTEDAYSLQTLHGRFTFEEKTGLCNVVPTDRIKELMDGDEFKRLDSQR
jgi:hypothetical protein